ncbi:hypothetical protein C2S53_010327 [Perilla frutescens var. hirtella]|uniref:Dirigent protein n=1 Tax=Perilla frutescens var. hirtella TaxID=608512 RepID=A0AAD4NZ96_PERFH|nr:hypothetical protein C2S53_010327 [Perilla frutescens var. hirtella]
MACSFDEHPEAVQVWFKNFPNLKEKVARFHFYIHAIFSGKNQTSFMVAEAKISATSPTNFDLIQMIDSPLTVGPQPDSKIIGRAQGTDGGSSFEEISLVITHNFLFTEGEYNGSMLSVLGREALLDEYRELPIVGGTGAFRLARGIITSQTASFNNTSKDIVYEVTAMVLYYVG